MEENLPAEIINAQTLFDRSFELEPSEDQVMAFRNAIYLLNDFKDDHPDYLEQVKDIKHRKTLDLFLRLSASDTPLVYTVWREYLMLFCIDVKEDVRRIVRDSHPLSHFLFSFAARHSEHIPQGFKKIIDDFLTDITDGFSSVP